MIKYNSNTINDWNYGDDNIAKVYYGITSGSTSRLPAGYTEVEYITSENTPTGDTGAYIDTNYIPNQSTRVVMDYQPIVNGQMHRRIFGSGEWSTLGYIFNMENSIGESSCYYYYKYGNTSTWYETAIHPDLNRHIVDFNNSGIILLDDVPIATLPSTTFTCTYNLGVFRSISDLYEDLNICFLGRVYSFKVYDNGTLVRDLVPCIRDNDNKVGMYDIVNDAFYTSANSNFSFDAGSAVTPSSSTTVGNVVYQKVANGSTPPTPPTPTFNGKWLAIYEGCVEWDEETGECIRSESSTTSAECDSSSAITYYEISKYHQMGNLVSVVIGDCVTTIDELAFDDYGSLTSVTISDSVTTIANSTFSYCYSLTSINIPSGVTSIGSGAFEGSNSLEGITINATTPPTLGIYVFDDTNDCPIYVPSASVNAYKSATNWSTYASRITAIP